MVDPLYEDVVCQPPPLADDTVYLNHNEHDAVKAFCSFDSFCRILSLLHVPS